jgi:5-methylcytosine-specific restriction enzyme subunit McrC
VRKLDGIALVEPTADLFKRLQIGRKEGPYPLAMNICRLVHRLEMPTERQGPISINALLHDEIVRHKVFERFVLNFYRLHLNDEFEASSEMLAWPDAFGCRYAPGMRTDITLWARRPPARRIVIDTKFSVAALTASPFGDEAFKPANLYQIYAYLRSQEETGDAHRTASGILLYPCVGMHLDEHMFVQKHRIRVATVDLGAPWPAIAARLREIVLKWPERALAQRHPVG